MVNHAISRKICRFGTPVSQKRRRQHIHFTLDWLSAQMNVPNPKFSGNSMKHIL